MKNILPILVLFGLINVCQASQQGIASWYGRENRISSTGKKLHRHIPAAAHKDLPIGSKIKVTSTKSKKTVIVIVEDRGPYAKNRIIDLNYTAAKQLGILKKGIEHVTIEKLW